MDHVIFFKGCLSQILLGPISQYFVPFKYHFQVKDSQLGGTLSLQFAQADVNFNLSQFLTRIFRIKNLYINIYIYNIYNIYIIYINIYIYIYVYTHTHIYIYIYKPLYISQITVFNAQSNVLLCCYPHFEIEIVNLNFKIYNSRYYFL